MAGTVLVPLSLIPIALASKSSEPKLRELRLNEIILEETKMLLKGLPLGAAAVLLLAVDWFAFHDIREPHTFRDYLTLAASMLVFFRVGCELVHNSMVYFTDHLQR
jgi:hypothetical protein